MGSSSAWLYVGFNVTRSPVAADLVAIVVIIKEIQG